MRFGRPGLISSSETSAPMDSSQPERKMASVSSPVVIGARSVVGIDRGDADELLEKGNDVLAHDGRIASPGRGCKVLGCPGFDLWAGCQKSLS